MTLQHSYGANGIIALFPFSFAIGSADDLEVLIDGIEQSSGFVVRGAGGNDGGSVLFDAPPANEATIVLRHRGRVSITALDTASGHLSDKLVAGDGISLTPQADDQGRQVLVVANTDTGKLEADKNLADLTDKEAARGHLGVYGKAEVYTKAETNTAISASSELDLKKDQNLFDVPNKATARGNLDVYSTSQVDAAMGVVKITAADTTPQVLNSKLALFNTLKKTIVNPAGGEELKLGLNGLSDLVAGDALKMLRVDAAGQAFELVAAETGGVVLSYGTGPFTCVANAHTAPSIIGVTALRGTAWTISGGGMVCPEAGVYLITQRAGFDGASQTHFQNNFSVNEVLHTVQYVSGPTMVGRYSMSMLFKMNAGDVFKPSYYINTSASDCYMDGVIAKIA